MSGKAAKIVLTEEQQSILQQIRRSRTAPQRLVQRGSIILLAFAGLHNVDIAPKVALARKQVGLWRRRWQQSFDALVAIECRETQAELHRAIEDVLSDAPRSGSTGTFTAEQVTLILAVACEPPEQSGRPIDRWTHRELADEVIVRGIVESISISQVGRYLAQAELQPHRSKYWLNTKEKDPEIFQQQVETVCQTYLEAPALYFQENTHTVSVDEMPGVQALERIAKTIPMQPGQPTRIEFEYKRHGTLCLTGNWDVVLGQMIAPTIGMTRTEEDFAWHIHNTIATDPASPWVFVVDNLNTHCSESLVRYVARLEGIDQSELGKKGKFGVLKSMATRQVFLSDRSHRIRFVYLPKHTSWLNQIEIVFGIVGRRVVRRGNFTSLVALKDRLLDFIEYFTVATEAREGPAFLVAHRQRAFPDVTAHRGDSPVSGTRLGAGGVSADPLGIRYRRRGVRLNNPGRIRLRIVVPGVLSTGMSGPRQAFSNSSSVMGRSSAQSTNTVQ